MESSSGSESKPQSHQPERKRLNRAPSPARPFLKDVHPRSNKPPAIVPKSPKLSKQQSASPAHPTRSSRRNTAGAKDKPAPVKSGSKSAAAKKPVKVPQHAAAEPRAPGIKPDSTGSPVLTKPKKGKPAPGQPGHESPIRVPTGAPLRVSQTDSSSDLSDCPSEPLSDEQRLAPAASSDAESGTGSSDRDQLVEAAGGPSRCSGAKRSVTSRAQPAPGPGQNPKPSMGAQLKVSGSTEEELLREIEDLRSENDYLKVWTSSLLLMFY